MADKKTIFRVACRHKPYSQLGNAMLRDQGLSIEARGTLGFILSHPQDWKFSLDWLARQIGTGRDKTQRIVRELVENGYCVREQNRDERGRLGPVMYAFSDEPEPVSPQPEKPVADTQDVVSPQPDLPATVKPATVNTVAAIYIDNKEGQSQRSVSDKGKSDRDFEVASRTDKFSAFVLHELVALGVDVGPLIERYETKTANKRIADPSAYLLRMGRDEAAKRCGATIEQIKGSTSQSRGERIAAAVSATGAEPRGSKTLAELLAKSNMRFRPKPASGVG